MHRQALLGFSLLDEDDGQAPPLGWLSLFPGQRQPDRGTQHPVPDFMRSWLPAAMTQPAAGGRPRGQ